MCVCCSFPRFKDRDFMLAVDTAGREFYLQVSVGCIPGKREMITIVFLGKGRSLSEA